MSGETTKSIRQSWELDSMQTIPGRLRYRIVTSPKFETTCKPIRKIEKALRKAKGNKKKILEM